MTYFSFQTKTICKPKRRQKYGHEEFFECQSSCKEFQTGAWRPFPSSETRYVVINENEDKGILRRSDPWARGMEALRRRPLRRLFSFSCSAFSWAFDGKRKNEESQHLSCLQRQLFRDKRKIIIRHIMCGAIDDLT